MLVAVLEELGQAVAGTEGGTHRTQAEGSGCTDSVESVALQEELVVEAHMGRSEGRLPGQCCRA